MRAATSSSIDEPLAVVDLASAEIGASGIRVRVRAAGVNPVDWKMRAGTMPLGVLQRVVGPPGPLVVGVDFAGEVTELGSAVTDDVRREFEVGTRVVGGTNFARRQRGSYADEVVVAADQLVAIPENVSYETAACLPIAAVTPWIALTEHHNIGKGHKVLVLGASGGVGLFAIQLARFLGAQAYGVCSTPNTKTVERLGAIAIDYKQGDPLTAAKAHGPFDLILHAVGTATYPLARCQALLAPKGVLDLVMVRPIDYLTIVWTAVRSMFVPTTARVLTLLGRPTGARLRPLVQALAASKIESVIEATYPLAQAEAAHQRSRAGKVVGKLVLTMES